MYDDRLIINFNYREDSETIPLELSVFGSDFNLMGEPNRSNPNSFNIGSDFFVLYEGKAVFGVVVAI